MPIELSNYLPKSSLQSYNLLTYRTRIDRYRTIHDYINKLGLKFEDIR